jgi:hypothetical protein
MAKERNEDYIEMWTFYLPLPTDPLEFLTRNSVTEMNYNWTKNK